MWWQHLNNASYETNTWFFAVDEVEADK